MTASGFSLGPCPVVFLGVVDRIGWLREETPGLVVRFPAIPGRGGGVDPNIPDASGCLNER